MSSLIHSKHAARTTVQQDENAVENITQSTGKTSSSLQESRRVLNDIGNKKSSSLGGGKEKIGIPRGFGKDITNQNSQLPNANAAKGGKSASEKKSTKPSTRSQKTLHFQQRGLKLENKSMSAIKSTKTRAKHKTIVFETEKDDPWAIEYAPPHIDFDDTITGELDSYLDELMKPLSRSVAPVGPPPKAKIKRHSQILDNLPLDLSTDDITIDDPTKHVIREEETSTFSDLELPDLTVDTVDLALDEFDVSIE
eukprot:CFRG1655T1